MAKAKLSFLFVLLLLPLSFSLCIKDPNVTEQNYSLLNSLKPQLIKIEPQRSDDLQALRSGLIVSIELSSGSVASWTAYNSIPTKIELASHQLKGTKLYYSLTDSKQNLLDFGDSLFVWTSNGKTIVDSFKDRTEECGNVNVKAALLDLKNFDWQKIIAYAFLPSGTKLQVHCFTGSGQINVYYFDGSSQTIEISKELGPKNITLGYLGSNPLTIGDIIELIKENKVCVEKNADKILLRWNPEELFSAHQTASQQETQAPLEQDPDNDGIPGSSDSCPTQAETFNGYKDSDGCPDNVPEQAETRQSYGQIQAANSMAEYNLIFLPLQWNHSLDSTSGSYEDNVNKLTNYFLQKTGLQSCNKVAKIVMSEEEVRDCGFETINLSCFDISRAPTLVLNCVLKKRGIDINPKNNIAIALTNFPNLRKNQGGTCKPVAASTTLFGQPIVIIANEKAPFVLAHEFGHRLFYFCDQYDVEEYVNQDFMLKRAGMPSFSPGCQNKYPGPYSIEGKIIHAVKRYSVAYTGGTLVITGYNPENCPSYPRCSYETGNFVTCCPNMNKATSYVDCTGRFIPLRASGGSVVRGVSIMGPAFRSNGVFADIPRDFDCFEREAIQKIVRC